MKKIFFLIVLSVISSFVLAEGVTNTALTYTDCYNLALANSYTVKIQAEKLKQANLDRLKAVGGLLPDVTLNHNRYYDYGTAFNDNGWDSSISATQPIFLGFSKFFNISQMDRLAVAEEYNLAQAKKVLAEQTAAAYFNLAAAEADFLNTQEAVNIMNGRAKELKQREALGKSRLSELYAVEARAAVLMAQLEQVKNDVLAAADALSLVLNAENVSIVQPVENESPGSDVEMSKASLNQPAVKSIEAAIEAQSSRINAQHSLFLPQVNLTVSKQIGSSPYASGNYGFVLMAKWPLFDGGARVLDTISEYSAEEALKQQRLALLKSTLYDIKARIRNYNASVDRVLALKEAYDKSSKSYKLQEKDYRYGMATNIEVLQAMADLTDIKKSLDREIIVKEKNRVLVEVVAGNVK